MQRLDYDVFVANVKIKNNLINRGYAKTNIGIAKLDANTKAIYEETKNGLIALFNNGIISEDIYEKYIEYMEEIYNEYAYRVNIMEQENEEKVFGI